MHPNVIRFNIQRKRSSLYFKKKFNKVCITQINEIKFLGYCNKKDIIKIKNNVEEASWDYE